MNCAKLFRTPTKNTMYTLLYSTYTSIPCTCIHNALLYIPSTMTNCTMYVVPCWSTAVPCMLYHVLYVSYTMTICTKICYTLLVKSCAKRSLSTFPESSSCRCCSCNNRHLEKCNNKNVSSLHKLDVHSICTLLTNLLISHLTWSRFFFSAKTSLFFISM